MMLLRHFIGCSHKAMATEQTLLLVWLESSPFVCVRHLNLFCMFFVKDFIGMYLTGCKTINLLNQRSEPVPARLLAVIQASLITATPTHTCTHSQTPSLVGNLSGRHVGLIHIWQRNRNCVHALLMEQLSSHFV